MGLCSSTTKSPNSLKHPHSNQIDNVKDKQDLKGVQGAQGGDQNKNYKCMSSSPLEEAYYQETALCTNFGSDFGPKEKVQLNVGIRNGQFGVNYYVQINMSYDKTGSNHVVIGKYKEEQLTNQDGTLNFSISVILDYFFEKQQFLFITVGKAGQQYKLTSTLGRVMGSRGQSLQMQIKEGSSEPENLLLCTNTVKNNNVLVCVSLSIAIKNKTASVFYLIKKLKSNLPVDSNNNNNNNTSSDYWKIQKSEVKSVGVSPVNFNQVRIPSMFLCNGDFEHPIAIEFHCSSDRTILGILNTTVTKLLSETSFEVGDVLVKCNSVLVKEHTFIDYLRGGLQLSLTMGIDFTGSNGSPLDKDSLHVIDTSGKPNQYQMAIRSCGDILAYYDYDQTFPVYGYGALHPSFGRQVCHCFPLNLSQDPNIKLINGVLDVYRNTMPLLSFSGPTYFAPLLNQAINNIKNNPNPNVYHILLILTDGMINDMEATINALVEASFMPLSVIIIGVGTADFGDMDALDADGKGLIDRNGRKTGRDLVQFVPFYKFANNGSKLAEQVLAEVPRQLVDYFKIIKQSPGDPIIVN